MVLAKNLLRIVSSRKLSGAFNSAYQKLLVPTVVCYEQNAQKHWRNRGPPLYPLPPKRLEPPEEEKVYATNDMPIPRKRFLFKKNHPWDVSVRYMESDAFKQTYGDYKVWQLYRRRYAGTPRRMWATKPTCVDDIGMFTVTNPCPICRDEYFTVDYRNTKLLKHFINPETGELYNCLRLGTCERSYDALKAAVLKARDHGLLMFPVPFRNYDYREYYPWYEKEPQQPIPQHHWKPVPSNRPRNYAIYKAFVPEANRCTLEEQYQAVINTPSGTMEPSENEWGYNTTETLH